MKKLLLLFLFCVAVHTGLLAQYGFENKVELTGVVMSADSLRYLPFVSVVVRNKDDGTTSNERGIFTLIAEKGDTLEYTSIGYRKRIYVIPKVLSSNRYAVIQLMTQDTFHLPTAIIRPSLSKAEFDKAFTTWNIPDDKYETARKNTEYQTMRMLAFTMPKDGREGQSAYQRMQVQRTYWAGQQPPMTIFSPLAWYEFYKSWKRGDYRRKK